MNINLTMFGQLIMFVMFTWFCMRFIWPPVVGVMNDRKQKIKASLLGAENALNEKLLAEINAREIIMESKDKATAIISVADQHALNIISTAKEDAMEEAKLIIDRAEDHLTHELVKARNDLTAEFSAIVMQGVSAIIDHEVNKKTHKTMLAKLSKSFGGS